MELLDEGVSLLRHAPPAALSVYFLGALPFCLGLIYFWFDMGESANAEARLPGEAFILAALYFWMKTCQAIFSRSLLAHLEGGDQEAWTWQRWANTALVQGIFAGSLLVVYPIALVATIPFGWVNAFYHSVSIVGTGPSTSLDSAFREAAEMAKLWPRQNHIVLGVLFLASFVLFLNIAIFCVELPQLLNSFFGVETVFDENLQAWNNSSFYLDVLVFCFLVLNPLNKAVYVLRCFYGRSRFTGTDLKAGLRRLQISRAASNRTAAAVFVLLLLAGSSAVPSQAAVTSTPTVVETAPDPAAAKLDLAIQQTLQRDEFAWRAPRVEKAADDNGLVSRIGRDVWRWLKWALRGPAKLLGKFFKWLFDTGRDNDASTKSGLTALAAIPWRGILLLLAIVLILALGYFLVRHLRRTAAPKMATAAATLVRTVDLEAENVQADALPEDSWLALAQQLIEKGELRLALRALYLATLSALARQELVRLDAAKSNRDYLVELTRRLRGETFVLPSFRENMRLFEASWYGTHSVTIAMIETMRVNQQQVGHRVAA